MKEISTATINRLRRRGFRELIKGQYTNKDNTLSIYLYEDKPVFQITITNIKFTFSEFFRELHKLKLQIISLIEILEQEYGNLRS